MNMIYTSFKDQVRSIINKHFPPEVSVRFTLRSDSQIWIPGEDQTIWDKAKSGKESLHILFDQLPLCEIPQELNPKFAELYFLRAFRQAIIDGKIRFDKKIEWSDNDSAKRNKRGIAKKKAKKLKAAIEFGLQHAGNTEVVEKTVIDQKRRIVKSKGGE